MCSTECSWYGSPDRAYLSWAGVVLSSVDVGEAILMFLHRGNFSISPRLPPRTPTFTGHLPPRVSLGTHGSFFSTILARGCGPSFGHRSTTTRLETREVYLPGGRWRSPDRINPPRSSIRMTRLRFDDRRSFCVILEAFSRKKREGGGGGRGTLKLLESNRFFDQVTRVVVTVETM